MALYDPNEFPETVETTTDFTPADVLAWARTKPADEEYDYCAGDACAVAQFLKETKRAETVYVAFNHWRDGPYAPMRQHTFDERIWRAASDAASSDAFQDEDWTFGAFADRLEKALAQ